MCALNFFCPGKPLSEAYLKKLSNEVFRHVNESLVHEGAFRYPGFGRLFLRYEDLFFFQLSSLVTILFRHRESHVFRSALHGGKTYDVAAKNVVRFRPSNLMKATIQESKVAQKKE